MKRLITYKTWLCRLTLVLGCIAIAMAVHAASITVDGINYTTASGGKATIAKYTIIKATAESPADTLFYTGDIVIPEKFTYEGVEYTVVATAANAFLDCKNLTSVQLPATCITIGRNSFKGCTKLATSPIPMTATSVGSGVFNGCSSLEEVTIMSGWSKPVSEEFANCPNLKRLIIAEGSSPLVMKIHAFGSTTEARSALRSIEYIYMGRNVDASAYLNNEQPFHNMTNLKTLVIGGESTTIQGTTFQGCTALNTITFNEGNKMSNIGSNAFENCTSLTSINIPLGVTVIEQNVFNNCQNLKNVTLSDGVTSIGNSAFKNTGLTSFHFPYALTSIGESAFENSKLSGDIELPGLLTTIGTQAFASTSLHGVTIPASVTDIGNGAFAPIATLASISLNAGNTSFRLDHGVLLNAAGTRLLVSAHEGNIGTSYSNTTVTTIDNYGLAHAPFATVYLPALASIGNYGFAYSDLETFTLESVVTAGVNLFMGSALNDIVIAEGRNEIPQGLCSQCTSLTSVTLPTTATNMMSNCFEGCTALEVMEIPANVNYMEPGSVPATIKELRVLNTNPPVLADGVFNENQHDVICKVAPSSVSLFENTSQWYFLSIVADESISSDVTMLGCPDGLYYATTNGDLMYRDLNGNIVNTNFNTGQHAFTLQSYKNRVYVAVAGQRFTYQDPNQPLGDGELFYVNNSNGIFYRVTVLNNVGHTPSEDPFTMSIDADENKIYISDRNVGIHEMSADATGLYGQQPFLVQNQWLPYYNDEISWGSITGGFTKDKNGIFWMSKKFNGVCLLRFTKDDIYLSGGQGKPKPYNALFKDAIIKTFYLDEENGYLYMQVQTDPYGCVPGIYRIALSRIENLVTGADVVGNENLRIADCELIDNSPIKVEGAEDSGELANVAQITGDGEYIYWSYIAPASDDEAIRRSVPLNTNNPLHHSGIKCLKAKPNDDGTMPTTVTFAVEGVEAYGVCAMNYSPYITPELEQTVEPSFNYHKDDLARVYYVEIEQVEPSTISYRILLPNGEWTEWTEYSDVLSFTENGIYRIEAFAIADGKRPSETIALEIIVDFPVQTAKPTINTEETDNAVIVTASGNGEVKLYKDGVVVENPCTIARTSTEQRFTFTATAQEDGKLISETATLVVTVPATEAINIVTDGVTYDEVNGFRIRNLWIQDRAHTPDVWSNKPYCNTYARTSVMSDGYIYISRTNAKTVVQGDETLTQSVIYKVDANTGNLVKELPLTLNGNIYGGATLSANSVGVDDFGHLYVAPYSSEMSSTLPVYMVDKETGELTLMGDLDKGDYQRCDYIDLIGDITREKAECNIMSAGAGSQYIFRWHADQGGDWEGGFDGDPYLPIFDFYPETVTNWGYMPVVKMWQENPNDYNGELFYVDGFYSAPILYDITGTMVDNFDGVNPDCLPMDNGANGICEFTLGGRHFIAFVAAQYTGYNDATMQNRACQVYICELGDGQSISGMQRYWMIPDELGTISDGGTRIECINVEYGTDDEGNDEVTLFIFKCYNGMGVYKITAGYGSEAPQTAAPVINGMLDYVTGTYTIALSPGEDNSVIYYRYINYSDDEWSEWMEYVNPIQFTEQGMYRIEAYAVAPGKQSSVHVYYDFMNSGPVYTATPTITAEETDNAVIVTAVGDGDVKLYMDGVEVENPYVIPKQEQTMTYTFTATAQEEGLHISNEASLTVTVPGYGSGITVYVKADWAPHLFSWVPDGNGSWIYPLGDWPGSVMSNIMTVNRVQYYTYTFDPYPSVNIILDNGSGGFGNQTGDFVNITEDAYFVYNGGGLAYGVIPPTVYGNPTGEYAFYVNTDHWSKVNAVLDGVSYPMTLVGTDGAGYEVYKWENNMITAPSTITFNDGAGHQVVDASGHVYSSDYVKGGYYIYTFFASKQYASLDMPTVITYEGEDQRPVLEDCAITLKSSNEVWNSYNDVSFDITGTYFNPAARQGRALYSVDGGEWVEFTPLLNSEQRFAQNVILSFNPDVTRHTIRLAAQDLSGAYSAIVTVLEVTDAKALLCYDLPELEYTGEPLTFEPSIYDPYSYQQLTLGEDYTVSFSNNVNVGPASMNVQAIYPAYIGETTFTYAIIPHPISGEAYVVGGPFYYNGNPFTPAVVVIDDLLGELSPGEDYTVTYIDNVDIGEAIALVEGIGRCTGEIAVLFEILDPPMNERDWNIIKRFYSQYQNDQFVWNVDDPVSAKYNPGLTVENERVTGIDLPEQGLEGGFPTMLLSLDELRTLDLSYNNLSGDAASDMAQYAAAEGITATGLQNLYINNNEFTGNVGQMAALFGNLTDLNVSANHFDKVYPMVNPGVNLSLSEQLLEMDADITPGIESLITSIPTICLYDHAAQTFLTSLSAQLTDQAQSPVWNMDLSFNNGAFNMYTSSPYRGLNGQILDGNTWLNSSWYNEQLLKVKFIFAPGDANINGPVDITDLQAMVNYIFGEYNRPFNYTAANLNNDNTVNVQDVVGEANLLLSMDLTMAASGPGRAPMRDSAAPQASLFWQDGVLYLNTTVPVAALDIVNDVNGDIKWNVANRGMVVKTARGTQGEHTVIYSLGDAVIPPGLTAIATTTSHGATVVAAKLSDTDAELVKIKLNDGLTRLTEVPTDGIVQCQIDGNSLIINSGNPLEDVNIGIYTIDGKVIADKHLSHLDSGQTRISMSDFAYSNGYLIIVVRNSRQVIATQKLTQIK